MRKKSMLIIGVRWGARGKRLKWVVGRSTVSTEYRIYHDGLNLDVSYRKSSNRPEGRLLWYVPRLVEVEVHYPTYGCS